jgi:formiminotetrahydrofolate cyclodeaminase
VAPARSLLDLSVRELLDAVAADSPAPAGGAAAAVATALAAALAALAARVSGPEFAERAAAADALRRRAAPLGDADGAAYADYLAALRLPKEPEPERRAAAVRRARDAATDVPAQIGEVAMAVAELAAELAGTVKPQLRGDAVAGALLAAAAAATAAELVEANVGESADDPRVARAQEAADTARAAVHRATVRASR